MGIGWSPPQIQSAVRSVAIPAKTGAKRGPELCGASPGGRRARSRNAKIPPTASRIGKDTRRASKTQMAAVPAKAIAIRTPARPTGMEGLELRSRPSSAA
jgi:hypothetical protein